MKLVEAAFAERSVLPPRDIRLTTFGNRVQEAGAGVVSLGGLYVDPIGAMRRAVRRPEDDCLTRPFAPRCKDGLVRLVTDPTGVLPRRVAVLSVHTSPLAQPGTGDAGA